MSRARAFFTEAGKWLVFIGALALVVVLAGAALRFGWRVGGCMLGAV